MDQFKVGDMVLSKVNNVAKGMRYKIIKMNKTTCWVESESSLCEDLNGKPYYDSPHLYKNVRYSILKIAS